LPKTIKQIREAIKWELPPKPGTAPIPKDHVRLYHQTHEKDLGAIKHQGLKQSHAKGIEGPKAIYADEKGFYGKPDKTPTVEFSVHKDRWRHPPFVTPNIKDNDGDDVKPHSIIAAHRPWHGTARYIEDNEDVKKAVLSGEHDNLLKDKQYSKAIRFIKHKYRGK
jgi:hypothetical protein